MAVGFGARHRKRCDNATAAALVFDHDIAEQRLDPFGPEPRHHVDEAAASLGATPFAAWRLVTLPLALPGLLAAGALSFILTMNAYATPLLLGGPRFQMIGPTLAREILNQANWPFGASLAFVLIAFTLASTALANVLIARAVRR